MQSEPISLNFAPHSGAERTTGFSQGLSVSVHLTSWDRSP
jgi:hypothetical protein